MNSHCSCGGKMRPQVDSRTSFTWRCEKCGETITQGKRLKPRTPEKDRLCVGCKHFEIDFGCVDSYNLGHAGSLECRQKKFEESAAPTESEFYRLIKTARTCDEFEVRAVS